MFAGGGPKAAANNSAELRCLEGLGKHGVLFHTSSCNLAGHNARWFNRGSATWACN